MACFVVPGTEAVVATIVAGIVKSREKDERISVSLPDGSAGEVGKIKLSTKLGWLNKMLWGGSALLAFEHVWHGEVVPWFPFLTAAGDPADKAEMLHEMATVGVSMAVLVTLVWAGMLGAAALIERRAQRALAVEA